MGLIRHKCLEHHILLSESTKKVVVVVGLFLHNPEASGRRMMLLSASILLLGCSYASANSMPCCPTKFVPGDYSKPLKTILTFDTLHCIARSQFHSGQIMITSHIDILIQEPSLSLGCTCTMTSSAEPFQTTASKPSQLKTVSGPKKNCSGTAAHT